MATRTGTGVKRDILLDATLPQATKSYTVISHKFIMDTIMKEFKEKEFTVTDEEYKANKGAQIASGLYRLNYGDDPDLSMLFAFSNSYDKSMRFKCAVGAYVKTNNASIISSNMSTWGRKHTGTADKEAEETIQQQLENAEAYFSSIAADKEEMLKQTLTERDFAHLLGELYVEKRLITGEQMSLAASEYRDPSFQYPDHWSPESLWTAYNHILIALSKSHPKSWMDQQKLVHFHLISEYDIAQFDEEMEEVPVEEKSSGGIQVGQLTLLPGYKQPEQPPESTPEEAPEEPAKAEAAEDVEQPEIVAETETVTTEELLVEHERNFHEEEVEDLTQLVAEDNLELNSQDMFKDLDAEEDEDWEKLQETGAIREIEEPHEHQAVVPEPEEDPIRDVISQEIFDCYDRVIPFTYELKDGQYNVTLETDEVMCLLQEYVDEKVTEQV